ncbi:MAG: glycoside hydrolase family 13 protein [Actinomycetota bacterium]|nr:glycoside hydrolase family 13 protein [Actinomycetota bacterium]
MTTSDDVISTVDVTAREDTAPWWREAVIYQVYVRSFADTDGDGLGDLPGIRSRLPYLRRLGVDAVWLNPFYPSPQADAGYDVADYRDVDPAFGTLADFDGLVSDAHDLGIRVLVDIVPNHTSSEHEWFRAALTAPRGSPERARYLFREGRGPGGAEPPNGWQSVFGASAWTRVTEADGRPGQWYLHLFDARQPDLDWMNPEVRTEFESILRFWLDRDVDGFRIDVAHGLAKDQAMPDLDERFATGGPAREGHPHWDQDEVHDVYRGWRRAAEEYEGERAFVGEIWLASPDRVARYLRPDELHTAFNFHFLLAAWGANELRAAIDRSIASMAAVGAPATWVLSNHDVTRHVTRYGGGDVGTRRARAAALLMLALPGSAYIYQGEELGLPEVRDLPDELRQDPTFRRTGGTVPGRDGCRVPLPWSGDTAPFGFGPGATTWLPQPAEWAQLTVAAQDDDPVSMLSLYRDALAGRRRLPALGDGALEWLSADPAAADSDDGEATMLAFRREPGFTCVVNFGPGATAVPAEIDGDVILASDPVATRAHIPADTAVWLSRTT